MKLSDVSPSLISSFFSRIFLAWPEKWRLEKFLSRGYRRTRERVSRSRLALSRSVLEGSTDGACPLPVFFVFRIPYFPEQVFLWQKRLCSFRCLTFFVALKTFHRKRRLTMLFLLLLPALGHAFPNLLACDRVIGVGEIIMRSAAVADTSR